MKILAIGKNYVSNQDEISGNKTGNQIIFSKLVRDTFIRNNISQVMVLSEFEHLL